MTTKIMISFDEKEQNIYMDFGELIDNLTKQLRDVKDYHNNEKIRNAFCILDKAIDEVVEVW